MIDDKIYLDAKPSEGQAVNLTLLRDYFAAKAMQGMMLQGVHFIFVDDKKNPANVAYEIADMMLEARETKEAK